MYFLLSNCLCYWIFVMVINLDKVLRFSFFCKSIVKSPFFLKNTWEKSFLSSILCFENKMWINKQIINIVYPVSDLENFVDKREICWSIDESYSVYLQFFFAIVDKKLDFFTYNFKCFFWWMLKIINFCTWLSNEEINKKSWLGKLLLGKFWDF